MDRRPATSPRRAADERRHAGAWWLALPGTALSPGCGAGDTSSKSGPTSTKSTSASSAPSNRIVFNRGDVGSGQSLVYTMNPDGSDTTSLFPRTAYGARWAPDRSEISIFCCDDGMSAHLVNLKTGALRTLNMPDPGLETFCGSAWSPDGKRLACESYGVDDPRRTGSTRSASLTAAA